MLPLSPNKNFRLFTTVFQKLLSKNALEEILKGISKHASTNLYWALWLLLALVEVKNLLSLSSVNLKFLEGTNYLTHPCKQSKIQGLINQKRLWTKTHPFSLVHGLLSFSQSWRVRGNWVSVFANGSSTGSTDQFFQILRCILRKWFMAKGFVAHLSLSMLLFLEQQKNLI